MNELFKDRCGNCEYFKSGPESITGPGGQCRRFPPKIIGIGNTIADFPIVEEDSWCGEYRRLVPNPVYECVGRQDGLVMSCTECGGVREDLNENDICPDCEEHSRDSEASNK